LANASEDFKFASAVAEFGLLLRDSKYKANASYDSVLIRAQAARGQDSEGYRSEFIQLVGAAKSIQN
jgi:Ca-activated chloride channel family protein